MSDESLIDDDPTAENPEAALIEDDGIEDATEALNEEDYDFLAFVQGVRPTRRAVMIYQRNDMRELVDTLQEKITVSKMAGHDTAEDEELLAEAAEEIVGSGKRVVVEAKSTDWVNQFRKDMKARGVDPFNKKASDEARSMMMSKYLNEYIAAHIVHPTTGISPDALAVLAENSETEVNKLHEAVRAADSERGVSPDFLQRPYGITRSGSR